MKFPVQRLFVFVSVAACVVVSSSAQSADTNAYLYIAHAAPGRNISSVTNPAYPVDISIGGHCVAQGLSFGEIRGPFTMPGGNYAVMVSVANSGNPCSNSPVFSAGVKLNVGTASFGVLSVNSDHQVTGTITPISLSPVSATGSDVVVANMTPDNLTATLTAGVSTTTFVGSANFAANSFSTVGATSCECTLTVTPEESTEVVSGQIELNLVRRSVYLVALAGSIADDSVQVVGPAVIKDVF